MKILLVGFGYVGQALAELLLQASHEVSALRRSPSEAPSFPRLVVYQGDASRAETLASIPRDFDQIVCAVSPDGRTKEAYRQAYPKVVETLRAELPAARIILISSTAVYDQQEGAILDERAEAAASSETAAQISLAERLLLGADSPASLSHVVVRASGIYGPGRIRLISSLVQHGLSVEEEDLYTSRIHRDDLARILLFIIDRPELSGMVLATDPHPATLKEMADWARSHIDAAQLPDVAAPARQRKNRRLVPARLEQLGYSFLYPSFREGYGALFER